MIFRVGQAVKLVSHEPEKIDVPIGAVGFVVLVHGDGDYDVHFPGYPDHAVPADPDWILPGSQIVPAVYRPADLRELSVA